MATRRENDARNSDWPRERYTDAVLRFTPKILKTPLSVQDISTKCSYVDDFSAQYKDPLLEETRAVLQQGVECKPTAVRMIFHKDVSQQESGSDNVWREHQLILSCNRELKQPDVLSGLSATPEQTTDVALILGMRNATRNATQNALKHPNAVVALAWKLEPKRWKVIFRFAGAIDWKSVSFEAKPIGCLVTHRRIYVASCELEDADSQPRFFAKMAAGTAAVPLISSAEVDPFAILNPTQGLAVASILSLVERAHNAKGQTYGPLLIQGPPGTGKTSTVVEVSGVTVQWSAR